MEDIIKSITEAEAGAAEIKAQAYKRAAEIAEKAEAEAAEIEKRCEAECKALRETSLKTAQAQAQERYDACVAAKRAEAEKYAAECLKSADTDLQVKEIVRRVSRGGC